MNFSLYNPKIEYSFTWGRPLKVLGEGKVCERDLDVKYDQGKGRRWTEEYVGVEFDKGITGVEAGFLEGFPNLKYLVIPYTLRSIAVTPKLKAMLQQKKVLVRGWYDSMGSALPGRTASRSVTRISSWGGQETKNTIPAPGWRSASMKKGSPIVSMMTYAPAGRPATPVVALMNVNWMRISSWERRWRVLLSGSSASGMPS